MREEALRKWFNFKIGKINVYFCVVVVVLFVFFGSEKCLSLAYRGMEDI